MKLSSNDLVALATQLEALAKTNVNTNHILYRDMTVMVLREDSQKDGCSYFITGFEEQNKLAKMRVPYTITATNEPSRKVRPIRDDPQA